MSRDRADTEKELEAVVDLTAHPTEDALLALAQGQTFPAERKRLLAHLDRCDECRDLLAALSEHTSDTIIGSWLSGYRVEKFFDKGAIGAVYLAKNEAGEQAAIKVLLSDVSESASHIARMRAEARTLSGVTHQNVVRVLGFGELNNGMPYVVMEFVDGEPLSTRLRTKAPSLKRSLDWLDQLLAGLEACHAANIIHRDLKPANVLVCESPRGQMIKLIDFGISRHRDNTRITSPQTLMGSAGYLAPELLAGVEADERSDLYAVGCIAWRLFTGSTVFPSAGVSPVVVMQAHAQQEPPKLREVLPMASPFLEKWVASLLEKDPARRTTSATAARDELDGVLSELEKTVIEHTPTRGGKALPLPPLNLQVTATDLPKADQPTRPDRKKV